MRHSGVEVKEYDNRSPSWVHLSVCVDALEMRLKGRRSLLQQRSLCAIHNNMNEWLNVGGACISSIKSRSDATICNSSKGIWHGGKSISGGAYLRIPGGKSIPG